MRILQFFFLTTQLSQKRRNQAVINDCHNLGLFITCVLGQTCEGLIGKRK